MIRLAILFFGALALSPQLRTFLRARAEAALAALRGAAAPEAFVAPVPAPRAVIEVGLEPGGTGPTLRNATLPGEIPLELLAPAIRERIRRSQGDRFAGDRLYEVSPGHRICRRQVFPDPQVEGRVGRVRPL